LWDAYAVWPWLEPQKGKLQWTLLDKLNQVADDHHVEVLLPIGLSPTWASARPGEPSGYQPGFAAEPADFGDWRRHVETVATRYAGRVHFYEIWNEPNKKPFYSGDLGTMVRLCREAYASLKRVDPKIQVVSPAATGQGGELWLDSFLAAGGGDCFDIVGF